MPAPRRRRCPPFTCSITWAMLDAPLGEARLRQCHAWLLAGADTGFIRNSFGSRIRIGNWRGPDAMQVPVWPVASDASRGKP